MTQCQDEIDHLCKLALDFGLVNRTGPQLPDGSPESDTDHTVMLGWLACSLAKKWYPGLNLGLVAQFALVHDAVEIYAGDVYSLGISADAQHEKELSERSAALRLKRETKQLPWFASTIEVYERQILPEARFVRALDKVLPKIVITLNKYGFHKSQNISSDTLRAQFEKQYKDVEQYAGEFRKLMELFWHCAERVIEDMK